MRVITWNRSFKGLPNADDGVDEFDSEEHETHATVLDKMLAWEKKLYDEVKVLSFYHLVNLFYIIMSVHSWGRLTHNSSMGILMEMNIGYYNLSNILVVLTLFPLNGIAFTPFTLSAFRDVVIY